MMDVEFVIYLISICIITAFLAAIIHTVYKVKLLRMLGKEKHKKTMWYKLIEKRVMRNLPKN